MATVAARHQHRHLKTLILLVVSMTGGTIFLYWVGKLAPVTPLRAKTAAAWNQIVIRPVSPRADQGFYHLRIDQHGRVEESSAWAAQRHARDNEGAIHIVVACAKPDSRVTTAQSKALTKTISNLRKTYAIPAEKVRLLQSSQTAGLNDRLRF